VYGLVNRAVEQMVTSKFGLETWQQICEKAGVPSDGFIALGTYPDEHTYQLVGAASEVLGLPAEAVLEAFGEHWVLQTARVSYGEIMALSGRSLPEFLQNLDHMHSRLELTFPRMQAPSFECTDVTEHSLTLHYHSARKGLLPFVVGLVKGLGQWFNTPATVEIIGRREDGAPHDTLLVTLGA
jgi:hypothetical protein